MVEFIRNFISAEIVSCPVQKFQAKNLSYSGEQSSYWNEGFYKAFITISDDIDANIMSFTYEQQIRNPEKFEEFR